MDLSIAIFTLIGAGTLAVPALLVYLVHQINSNFWHDAGLWAVGLLFGVSLVFIILYVLTGIGAIVAAIIGYTP